jgi:hypothetical protein
MSLTSQNPSTMRVLHKIGEKKLLAPAVNSYFDPPLRAANLFFAIEWLAMATTYAEVHLVNAMTALENLIDSNLTESENIIESRAAFKKRRRVLRGVVARCFGRWEPEDAGTPRSEMNSELMDLNRRSLRSKRTLLSDKWSVPLDRISDQGVKAAINARNAVVHSGVATDPD